MKALALNGAGAFLLDALLNLNSNFRNQLTKQIGFFYASLLYQE